MPTHEAEAVVLRQYALADSDRIIVFVTREYGKVRAAAQGVRKTISRFGGCLEPLNHVHIEFVAREGRDLVQVRQAEIIHSYLGKKPSLEQVYGYWYFAEIINELVVENNPNIQLFRLFLASLSAGEKANVGQALVRYFEIWSLRLSGLLPNYVYCSGCGKCVKDDGFFAWVEAGQVRCRACAHGRGLLMGRAALVALRKMAELSPERFAAEPLPNDAAVELENLAQKLLCFHLEKQLKSYRILKEIIQGQ